MPLLPMDEEKMPISAGATSPFPITGLSGGAKKSVPFQIIGQPNRFGGIYGGIIGISHFKPLI